MCHLVDEDEKIFEDIFVKEIDSQCKDCHEYLGLSHPTGMRPTMNIPEDFPLNSQGRVTCATCHKIHGDNVYLLNGGMTGKAFCYLCHSEGLESVHAGVGADAHSVSKDEVVDIDILLDELSIRCMSCHDSTIGKEAHIGLGTQDREGGGSHPIGVDYMEAYSKGGFAPPSVLNDNLRLFNGKVGCGTCHNSYSKEPFELTINNNGSALCLECHRI